VKCELSDGVPDKNIKALIKYFSPHHYTIKSHKIQSKENGRVKREINLPLVAKVRFL
jgi:hypothetical protein